MKTRSNKKTWTFDEQENRMKQIMTSGKSEEIWKSPRTIECYRRYSKENISAPCILTGIEDFLMFDGFDSQSLSKPNTLAEESNDGQG